MQRIHRFFKNLFPGKGDGTPEKRKKVSDINDNGKEAKAGISMKVEDDDSSNKTGEMVTEEDNGSLNKTEEPVAVKDEDSSNKTGEMVTEEDNGSLKKTEEPVAVKDEDLSNKTGEMVTEGDNGSLNKTEEPVAVKDEDSSTKTGEMVTKEDNGSLNKTEQPVAEKDEDSSNKTEMSVTEKDYCLFNESEKPMTDRENRSEGHNKNDEHMKKDNDKAQSTASTLKECFGSVKVSKHDAIKVQRGLEGEIFEKLSEGCEVMNATKIPFSNLEGYLDYLQGAFEEIDDDVRTNINSKLSEEKAWNSKMVEWNFKKSDDSGIRYGLIAFGRSKDQQYVDCMYVLYKMDFVLTQKEIVTEEKFSWFLGFKTSTSLKVDFIEKQLDAKLIQDIQNFFRVKALEKIYKEGYIESINFVDSLDEKLD